MKDTNNKPAAYALLIPGITEVARERGYAIAVHGSLNRDLDLIAVPWTDEAVSPDALIEAIRESVDGFIIADGTLGGRYDAAVGGFVDAVVDSPSHKPHGRLAWNIHLTTSPFVIDISVMPCVDQQVDKLKAELATAKAWIEFSSTFPDEHIAWLRYSNNSIVTCDSDSPGAFRVYKRPAPLPENKYDK